MERLGKAACLGPAETLLTEWFKYGLDETLLIHSIQTTGLFLKPSHWTRWRKGRFLVYLQAMLQVDFSLYFLLKQIKRRSFSSFQRLHWNPDTRSIGCNMYTHHPWNIASKACEYCYEVISSHRRGLYGSATFSTLANAIPGRS